MAAGSVWAVGSGTATVASPAAIPATGGLSGFGVVGFGTVTGLNLAYAADGVSQLAGKYEHVEGAKVLASYERPMDSYKVERGKELAFEAGMMAVGGAVSKTVGGLAKTAPVKRVVSKVMTKVKAKTEPWGAGNHGAPGERPGSGKGVTPEKKVVQSGAGDGKVAASGVDYTNKGLYDSHTIKATLEQRYPGQVTSTTIPDLGQKNVKLAGQKHPKADVVFDSKGFPIFEKHLKYDTKISRDVSIVDNPASHMRAATRDLRDQIQLGYVDKELFNTAQLKDIYSGKSKIKGYTWHHHQDTGRMQLIPE